MVVELHLYHGLSERELARKFEVPRRTIRDWCAGRYRRGRAVTPSVLD